MDELIFTIILSVIFLVHILTTKLNFIPQESWLFAILFVVATDVAPMSHMWHILYGEDRITCLDAKNNQVFGWLPCFELNWNTLVNTYELTLPVEFLTLAVILYYVSWWLFRRNVWLNVTVYILNTANVVLAFILLFSPPSFLNDFTSVFNLTSFIIGCVIILIIEVGGRLFPYRLLL